MSAKPNSPLGRLLHLGNAPRKGRHPKKRRETFDQIAASVGIFVALQLRKTYITFNR
ncbi:hypothetical protein [uncultured Roseobacter sp.]|uniref:hypothetical protein n=1 Tax=uncultured Roseobacter sp. TaxID=114847 RepID=UPI00263953C3|nr:hypothetical protein [uncultured Roseobacter sp.]